jgi:HD-GYP domain-containing protein (c-di-GMP phosphodiesterase class II)
MTNARNAAVLETLRGARTELIDSALEVVSAPQRRLLHQALAHSFVDAYLDAVADQQPARLAVWVESQAANDSRDDDVSAFFSDAGQAFAKFVEKKRFGDVAAAPLRALRPVAPAIAASVRRPEVIADIDGAINYIVTRLSSDEIYAGDHARQVSTWAKRLARQLALSDADVALVSRCGLVHDIGELALPVGIVSDARPLGEDEINLVRTHVLAGEAMALEDPLLAPLANAIRWHHERYDGGGYPDGLRGEAIPLEARIVAVADSFNAMVGRRPHREPITAPEAFERLRLGSETQFDPGVVSALGAILGAR